MRTNLHHLIEDRARSHPDSPVRTLKQETLDYDALWTQAGGVAAGLGELGLAREQRIAVFLDKRIETFAAIPRSPNGRFDQALLREELATCACAP
jgi:acyl-CoA synthetase (AMP-forming)/AMP-acid ligase II